MTTIYLIFLLNIYMVCNVTAFTSIPEEPIIHRDDLKEDDHGEFELSDIIALSEETIEITDHPVQPEEKIKAYEIHNAYRRNWTYPFVEGSDLAFLEWNNTLMFTAMLWARKCIYGHGFDELDNISTNQQGQCMYRGPGYIPSRGIYNMYTHEYGWWYFENHTCWRPRSKYMCWHAFQIMMGKSEHIGFYRVQGCFPRYPEAYMLVWHYYKGGILEWHTSMVYTYGHVCSKCKPGYNCATNMCIPDPKRFCKAYNLDCECKRNCKNCGTPDWKNCRCNCKYGWDFPDCSFVCQNREDYKLKKSVCAPKIAVDCHITNNDKGWFARDIDCRAGCKSCLVVPPDAKPDELCCGGKICTEFYALDTSTCECQLLCPSDICLYHINVTTTTTTSTTMTPKIQTTVKSIIMEKFLTKKESLTTKKQSTTSSRKEKHRPTSTAVVAALNREIFLIVLILIPTAHFV